MCYQYFNIFFYFELYVFFEEIEIWVVFDTVLEPGLDTR